MKQQLGNKYYQMGMSMYGIMFTLVFIGFVATAVVSLGPSYIDNNTVKSALKDVQQSYAGADMEDIKDNEIRGKLSKYFQVNMVSGEIEKAAKVTRDKQKVILSVNYEIRSHYMGNVDLVLVFNNEVDLAK